MVSAEVKLVSVDDPLCGGWGKGSQPGAYCPETYRAPHQTKMEKTKMTTKRDWLNSVLLGVQVGLVLAFAALAFLATLPANADTAAQCRARFTEAPAVLTRQCQEHAKKEKA